MSDNLLHLDIVTPRKIFFSGEVRSYSAPGVEGGFEILARHAPFVTTLQPGKVRIISKEKETKVYSTSGGTVEVHGNNVTFLAETIELKDEIDIQRAEAAKQRAEKRLKDKEPGTDFDRAKIALMRALTRIKIASS